MKTNTILTFLVLVLCTGLSINAQDFKFGFLTGIDVVNIRLKDKIAFEGDPRVYDPMISFHVNGYVGFKGTGFWGLSVEPGFIQKGGIQKSADDNIRIQLNYIQLPILADFYLSDKIFVSVGPEFGYMMSAKAKSKDISNDISFLYDNEFEVSGLIGINYNIIDKMDLGFRYSHGLTYTSKITWTNVSGNPKGESSLHNQYLQFLVRFKV
jgi:hypothetical protein